MNLPRENPQESYLPPFPYRMPWRKGSWKKTGIMEGDNPRQVVYWDASAVLSTLFEDTHSSEAQQQAQKSDVHLLSTLAYAETCAVIARLQEAAQGEDMATQIFSNTRK